MAQTVEPAQAQDEARRKLADEIEQRIADMRHSIGDKHLFHSAGLGALIYLRADLFLAALRAQPERGAEEKEPSPGLLMSMAMRYDHAIGCPGYYDRFGSIPHRQRLENTLSIMTQLWEEVTGNGFYKPTAEADYAARLEKLRALPLNPAKDEGAE